MKFYTQYKGVWYKYNPKTDGWILSSTQDGSGYVQYFGPMYRIDQCFELWFKVENKNLFI